METYKNKLFRLYIALFLASLAATASAQLRLDIQSGAALAGYNDVRVPNTSSSDATFFSLKNDFSSKPSVFVRGELSYTIADRHTIELTAAPLILNFDNLTLDSVNFDNRTFRGDAVTGRYEFNTYRLSYRYGLIRSPKVDFDLGATVLMRDARIAVSDRNKTADDTDLGFVPLVSFNLAYMPAEKWTLMMKGDALIGTVGRAEDIFTGVKYNIYDEQLQVKAGYRFIEGGADIAQVYNFAMIHFINVGVVSNLNLTGKTE